MKKKNPYLQLIIPLITEMRKYWQVMVMALNESAEKLYIIIYTNTQTNEKCLFENLI